MSTDKSGHVVSIISSENDFQSLYPTDKIGREIRPIVFFNGTALSTDTTYVAFDSRGQPVVRDDENNALGPDGKQLKKNNDGNFVYPPIDKFGQPLPTDLNFRPIYNVVNSDGIEFPKNSEGLSIDNDGNIFSTDSMGKLIGSEKSPLPTDYYSRFIVGKDDSQLSATTILPTDELGYLIYPIVDSDSKLFSTIESGAFVNTDGEEFQRNDQGIPINENGEPLPTNSNGEFVYFNLKLTTTIKPNLIKENQIVIINPDKKLMTTDSYGRFTNADGNLIPTNTQELPLNNEGILLPTDSTGSYIYLEDETLKALPTDNLGNIVYPIVNSNGIPLRKNLEGRYIDDEGNNIPTDKSKRPLDKNKTILPKDSNGNYIFHNHKLESLDNKKSYVINQDGFLLPTDKYGKVVDKEGSPIPTNNEGSFISLDNSPLPTNTDGQFVIESQSDKFLTDNNEKPIYSIVDKNGKLLSKDNSGRYIDKNNNKINIDIYNRPLDRNGNILPKNNKGDYIFFNIKVVNSVGTLLPTSKTGQYIDSSGNQIAVDNIGRPIDINTGNNLPKNNKDEYVYNENNFLTTTKIVQINPDDMLHSTDNANKNSDEINKDGDRKILIIGEDKMLLPTDNIGQYLDDDNKPISTNRYGQPIDKHGSVFPTNEQGFYIYEKLTTPKPLVIVDLDGKLLSTDISGNFIDKFGKILPTSVNSKNFVDVDGSPLPTNTGGQFVLTDDITIDKIKILPTDESGLFIYPVFDKYGNLLKTDTSGKYIDHKSQLLNTDEFGRPIDEKNGNILPTNSDGNFVYLEPEINSNAYITDPDGNPLPTYVVVKGQVVNKKENLVAINKINKTADSASDKQQPLPTDDGGKFIYPIIDSKGILLPKDDTGHFVNSKGDMISLDDFGKPLDNNGDILPTNSDGVYIFNNLNEIETLTTESIIKLITTDISLKSDANKHLTDTSLEKNNIAYPKDNYLSNLKKNDVCFLNSTVADIIISINDRLLEHNSKSIKETIENFTKNLGLEPDLVRVAILHFGRSVEIPVNLGGYHEKEELIDHIRNLKYNNALGSPDLRIAYRAAHQQFNSFGRPDVQKIIIIFSSGEDM